LEELKDEENFHVEFQKSWYVGEEDKILGKKLKKGN